MPDFFINNSRTDFSVNPETTKQINQSSKSYWDEINAQIDQKNADYLENVQRYSVNIPQEQYNVIKDVIADAENPEEEAYRWASALELNKQYGMPVDYCYQNLEQINAAIWGDRYSFTPKTNFKAIVDNGHLGWNTLQMGKLGSKIMLAESAFNQGKLLADDEDLESLYKQYEQYEHENESLQDFQDRNFIIECLKFGAQSAPFTGSVIAASAVGSLLAPGVGTAAAFATSMANAAGLQYMQMRKDGSSAESALGFSLVSGALQAVVETSLGNVAGALGRNSLGDLATDAVKQKITGNVFKRLVSDGTFKSLGLRLTKEYLKENWEEGLEEVIQNFIEKGTSALAAELGGYNVEGLDAESIAKETWENFKGGVMGSLILGLPTSAIKVNASVKEFADVRKAAEIIPSQEAFNKATDDSIIWDGLSDEEKKEAQKNTWEKAQARVEAAAETEAKKIAEGLDAGEGAEQRKTTTDENGNVIEDTAEPVARDEAGRLFTQNVDIRTDDEGNTTGGTFVVGDRTKNEANRYGYINYETAKNGDITITDFKMNKDREGLRGEVFAEFAREHPDVNIEWNAIGSDMQDAKQKLIDENPNGSKNGLNYYTSESLNDIQTKKDLGRAIREKFHNVKAVRYFDENNQAKIRYDKTQLTSGQVASVIALFDTMAQKNKQSLSAFLDQKFVKGVFGTTSEMQADVRAYNQKHVGEQVDENRVTGGFIWKDVEQGTRAIIYAAENADYLTLMHELAHFYQSTLTGDLKAEAEAAFDVQDGDWSAQSKWKGDDGKYMSKYEAFAYHFQDWLTTGRVKNETWKNIFEKFAQFLAQAYTRLKNHLAITPEIESVFEKMLGDDKSIMAKALKAAQEEEGEYRAMLKRDAEAKEAQKKAEAEEAKRQKQAEREEASEGTDFSNEEAEQSTEEIEKKLDEVTNEKEPEGNAIDDALENLNLTDEQKDEISEVLNDASTTVVEKAEAATEAASSVYDEDDNGYPEIMFQMTFDEAQKIYPNIVDISEAFDKKPTVEDIKSYIQNIIGKEITSFDLAKKIVIPQNRDKRKHIVNSSRYEVLQRKNRTDERERHNAYVISAEDLLNHASYIGTEENAKTDKKRNVLQYHIFNVPVFINGHGYNVRIVAEEKNSTVAQPQNKSKTRAQNSAAKNTNATLDKLQVVELYDIIEKDILFQIAGEIGAENLDNAEVQEGATRMQNLAIAKQMDAAGEDAQKIRLATGWEKGSDGKWRYEIDDSKFETDFLNKSYNFIKENPRYTELVQKLKDNGNDWEKLSKTEQDELDTLSDEFAENYYKKEALLSDILDAKELYAAYPQLKDVPVKFTERDWNKGYAGQMRSGIAVMELDDGTYDKQPYYEIEINSLPNDYNTENIRSTLLHEIQHIIQRIEGFATGGNLDLAAEIIEKNNEKKQIEKKKALAWAWRNELIATEKEHPELRGTTKVMDALLEEYKEDNYDIKRLEEEGWIPEEDVRIKGFNLYVRGYDKEGYEDAYNEWSKNIAGFKPELVTDWAKARIYTRFGGEVESRNVQARMNFTQDQRINTLLAATEDVARDDQIMLFQTVYHGSGADFDKFDTENYGLSGEGSMSFGYGTYLTDSEEIARDYAERQGISNTYITLNGEKWKPENESSPLGIVYNNLISGKTIDDVNTWASTITNEERKKSILDAIKYLEENNVKIEGRNRNFYTVEIPDNGYIVWDKDVDAETKKFVEDAVFEKLTTEPNEDGEYVYKGAERELREELNSTFGADIDGEALYNDVVVYLGDEKTASKFLNKLGFVGINYPAYSNFGNAMGKSARNFVIFNDDDAQIVDKLLFQTQAELMDEARTFESWQEFMEYCEMFHADDEVSPIPSDSDAQWYQSFWEQAKGVQTEQEKNEEAVEAKNKKDGMLPGAVDALFTTMIKSNQQMVDEFLQAVAEIDAIDLDSEEWAVAADAEDAAQRERIDQLKDFINITLSDYNWQTALKRIQGGHEISEGLRKRLIGEMTDGFKARDFRALYAEVMNDEQYAVAEEDSITATLNKKLKKYHDIVKPTDDISRWSPERRKQLAEQLQNREIAAKIKNGSLKLDDELDAYIKSLNSQIKEKQKQFDELEAETKADYQRIADKEKRDLLKLHEQLLLARGRLKSRNAEVERKIAKGLKITDKYSRITQNLNADYDEIFRKYSDLRNTITINAEVQAALDRQEQVAGLRDDLNAKQKEKNLTAEVKKMRIQLVRRTMRRVPFNRIDYNNAKTVIAIQRMLEPNLLGGVNRFIGIDSPYLRGVISQIVTDSEYKEMLLHWLDKHSRSSQAFADFMEKIRNLKSIKDFESWTAKERKAAIRYLPKENWIRDLNLKKLAEEREESIDLNIGMEEVKRTVYDEKTGEPKTYKDNDGNTHNVTETAFRLKYDDEIGKLVQDAVGADMFDKIVNMPFSEWTTEDLEALAQRIDEIYTEGRDLLAAKNEARKREAAAIRQRIEDAIKETGITFNDDDTPEERKRKQKQIDKILGMSHDLKGTEAGKSKGFIARLNRLLHSYSDMNVMRFARMLDGQSEGENYRMLYRKEDDCYNAKQRSMASRATAVNKVMADNKITEGDLAKVVKVPELDTEFTVDELLYFLAADKDYVLKRDKKGNLVNDDWAATSRNAVMFGNMMSDMESQELKEQWAKEDDDMGESIKNDNLTPEQRILMIEDEFIARPGTKKFIAACHARWEAVINAANKYLNEHPEYKALMESIEADYASQYERMNEVSITEFNQPVHRVKAYVPLVRRESNGDTNEAQVKEDLLGASGVGKQWADKGMTKRRIKMNPLHQKPVQTGLFRTWGDSIERTEHFIAYSPYVRQLNAIYKSRDASYTRRFIESRYGAGAIKYLDEYINEVANPNAGRIRERGAEWLHVLRGKTAPAYLGWKASGIIKQGLTSPWPYMQFVNPAEYLSAAMKFTFNPEMREAISKKSIYMKMRRMDPVNDLIDEMADNAKSKLDRGWSKFSQIGMQGLEFIDWACVAPGWLACYEKKYNQLQNASNARYEAKMDELKERNMYADVGTSEYLSPQQMEAEARKEITEDIETEAVRYADDCTRACQPSNRVTDLAPLFKNSSEAMKAFLQFQTSLNVIWQNLRYDLPYAVKQKEFKRIAGTVIGYVMAGIFMNSVMDGIGGDDDDDDTQALRNLIYYSTTQFTDAIPIMGSEITNAMDKIITGKRAYAQSGTDMTPSATKLLNAMQKATSGDFKKAASLTAEGIGLFMGAPVSGVKEINKLLGKPLKNGDVDLLRGLSDVYGIAGDILEE